MGLSDRLPLDLSSLQRLRARAARTLRREPAGPARALLEAQRAAFRQIHRQFQERAAQGEQGLGPALEALDALWRSLRQLRVAAPFAIEAITLVRRHRASQALVDDFYAESTALLEDGIRQVFAPTLERLAVPPHRMAMLVRTCMEGLLIELAYARSPADLARVDQAYADMRALFQRFALSLAVDASADGDEFFSAWGYMQLRDPAGYSLLPAPDGHLLLKTPSGYMLLRLPEAAGLPEESP